MRQTEMKFGQEYERGYTGINLFPSYDRVIVSYSTGIDSTGTLYWALDNFSKHKITVLYCDTGLEYAINESYLAYVCKELDLPYVVLKHPLGFIGIIRERKMFPDAKYRWCTGFLKTETTNSWIRENREKLGKKVLFLTGERWDESPKRSTLPQTIYHKTHLKTKRVADFQCHWHRPVLEYEKSKMFEWGKKLGIEHHPCYEHVTRCSCFACILMPDEHAKQNIRFYPEQFKELLKAEEEIGHTWKHKTSLKQLWLEVQEEKKKLAQLPERAIKQKLNHQWNVSCEEQVSAHMIV